MPFDWELFIEVADNLATNNGEHFCRCAVSRAYYAVFGVAWSKLDANDRNFVDQVSGKKHDRTWQLYESYNTVNGDSIGEMGIALRNERALADYVGGVPVTLTKAQVSILQAKTLITELNKL